MADVRGCGLAEAHRRAHGRRARAVGRAGRAALRARLGARVERAHHERLAVPRHAVVLVVALVVERLRAGRRPGIRRGRFVAAARGERHNQDQAPHGLHRTQEGTVRGMSFIEVFKGWGESIRQDIDAFKALLESPKADAASRKLAGGALNYQISKLDLIPDWNEGIGVVDDLMVLRLCAQLSQGYDRGPLPAHAEIALDRIANEADKSCAF